MNCPPILAICNKQAHGDAHWRLVRPLTRLREMGADTAICWLGPDEMPTLPVAGRVVVLQRVIVKGDGPEAVGAWTDRLRAAGALAVVFEIDDDELSGAQIDHLDATEPLTPADRAELELQQRHLRWTLQACDGATVSTEPLAEVVRRYTDRPVIVVPNAIDVEWFRARLAYRAPWADHTTIGWTGWRRPDADLAPVAEAWERIARKYPDVRFVVGGHQPDIIYARDIPLDRIIRLPISDLDGYPRMYQTDIGCCSVADTPFSRCKTTIKLWEYTLAGASVVASRALYQGCCLLSSDHLAREGNVDDWEYYLDFLTHCSRVGQGGPDAWLTRHVEEEHGLRHQLGTWVHAYQDIAENVGVMV